MRPGFADNPLASDVGDNEGVPVGQVSLQVAIAKDARTIAADLIEVGQGQAVV